MIGIVLSSFSPCEEDSSKVVYCMNFLVSCLVVLMNVAYSFERSYTRAILLWARGEFPSWCSQEHPL